MAQYSFLKMENLRFIFRQALLAEQQKASYVKQYRRSFHKSYATTVAMAAMMFQNGGYFGS